MDATAKPLSAFRPDAVRLGVFLLAAAAGLWLYTAHGCDSDVAHEGHSIFAWVAMHWRLAAKDFQINWAICAVAAFAAPLFFLLAMCVSPFCGFLMRVYYHF